MWHCEMDFEITCFAAAVVFEFELRANAATVLLM